MRKKSVRSALMFIPDAPGAGNQRRYKKRVWKSLSWIEKAKLVRIGRKIIAKAQMSAA